MHQRLLKKEEKKEKQLKELNCASHSCMLSHTSNQIQQKEGKRKISVQLCLKRKNKKKISIKNCQSMKQNSNKERNFFIFLPKKPATEKKKRKALGGSFYYQTGKKLSHKHHQSPTEILLEKEIKIFRLKFPRDFQKLFHNLSEKFQLFKFSWKENSKDFPPCVRTKISTKRHRKKREKKICQFAKNSKMISSIKISRIIFFSLFFWLLCKIHWKFLYLNKKWHWLNKTANV